jgi:hypothetical protein
MKKCLIAFLPLLFLTSCIHGDEKKYVITKFDHPIYDTIKPLKDVGYTTQCIKVKGYVDDSIFVSFGDKRYGYYLSKEIDTLFNSDYYGDGEVQFVFDPYKAKKGKVEVTFSLLGSYK